jgi:hypothetical protein
MNALNQSRAEVTLISAAIQNYLRVSQLSANATQLTAAMLADASGSEEALEVLHLSIEATLGTGLALGLLLARNVLEDQKT